MRAKPFLKWVGGKTQLIEQIKEQLPDNIQQNNFTYIEPFVGSGAVLFWMLEHFPNLGITLKSLAIRTHSFSPDNYQEEKGVQTIATIPYAKVA